MTRSNQRVLRLKAGLANADLVVGGLLSPQQTDMFIKDVQAEPTMMRDVRVEPMLGPTKELNRIAFGSRILRLAPAEYSAVQSADHVKPTTTKVTLTAKKLKATVPLSDDSAEDSIERGNLPDTVLSAAIARVALDLEDIGINAVAQGSPANEMEIWDGFVQLTTSNVVNANGATISKDLLKAAYLALPTRFQGLTSQMRFYLNPVNDIEYRDTVANRQTAAGDQALSGSNALTIFGSPITRCANMPATTALFTHPDNLIVGFHREIRVASERKEDEETTYWYISFRADVKIIDEAGCVKITNLTPPTV